MLDTDVVIGALDRRDAHHRKARALLLRLISDGVTLHLSVINYAESLVKPAENPTTLRQAIEAIETLGIHLHSPDAGMARDAARLRSPNISLADGFALATAKRLGASVASYDRRVRTAAHKEQLAIT